MTGDVPTPVHRVPAAEAAQAAETLAAAFHDDPVPRLLAPQEADRQRVGGRSGFVETGRLVSENTTWYGMVRQPR